MRRLSNTQARSLAPGPHQEATILLQVLLPVHLFFPVVSNTVDILPSNFRKTTNCKMAIDISHRYEAVGSSDVESRSSREQLSDSGLTLKTRRNPLAWLCAISWTITILTLSLQLWKGRDTGHFSYSSGWDTELGEKTTIQPFRIHC